MTTSTASPLHVRLRVVGEGGGEAPLPLPRYETAGASGMAGGAQALMAAFSKANASESGGGSPGTGDLMASAGGVGGGDSSGGGSALAAAMGDSGGGSFGAGSSPGEVKSSSSLGATAAKVGRVAAGTAANLAQGSWDVAKAKASSLKDAAMDRIGETTGGKIAAAINASGIQEPAFSGDSLSGASDEVAAFVNKPKAGTGEQEHDASTSTSAVRSGASSTKSVFD